MVRCFRDELVSHYLRETLKEAGLPPYDEYAIRSPGSLEYAYLVPQGDIQKYRDSGIEWAVSQLLSRYGIRFVLYEKS